MKYWNLFSFIILIPFMFPFKNHAQNMVPFKKGINLTNWFQVNEIRQVQFNLYTKKDFEQIKSLGCDVIRLPIHLHSHTNGYPNYEVHPLLFEFLDEIVTWCETLGLHLILDNHTFDSLGYTPPKLDNPLLKIWPQVAAHFKDRYKNIYYEILNEPNGISDQKWNEIQIKVINAIREKDKIHTIIIGPANWNNYQNLKNMPVYTDKNLIYTFHFYEPFLFTHQGATWTTPSMEALKNIPFPFLKSNMPVLPSILKGTWIENAYNGYDKIGSIEFVKEQLSIVSKFSKERNVPIFCGEFGVYSPYSVNVDRIKWYEIVRKELESLGIPWTIWDYHGGFGIFNNGSNGLFDHDLNTSLLQSLGLESPPQFIYEKQPLDGEKYLYRDGLALWLKERSYGEGIIDYYNKEFPLVGNNALKWQNPKRYNAIGWKFVPEVDLSLMKDQNYSLKFFIKGNIIGKNIDVRFIDSKNGENDRPWRMSFQIDEKWVKWDHSWQEIQIPLSFFRESGSWENNNWQNPMGKFDWKSIDRLEFVTESSDLLEGTLYFDDVRLSTIITSLANQNEIDNPFYFYPNPATNHIFLYENQDNPIISYKIFDMQGVIKQFGSTYDSNHIQFNNLLPGCYLIQFIHAKEFISNQLLFIQN